MSPRLRLSLLRLTAMAGLVVSALLTYDKLNPDRAFCPLAEACQQAGASALGTIAGVPTAVLGMVAFGGLFLLTLLPMGDNVRKLLKVAGLLGAIGGAVFFGYQALKLDKYCPLCLVADAAGLVAGVLTLTWSRGARGRESVAARVAWLFAAVLATVLPFAWPRPERPAFVEIEPAANLFEDEPVAPTDLAPAVVAQRQPPGPPPSRVPPGSRQGIPQRPDEVPPPAPSTDVPLGPPPPALPAPLPPAPRPPPVAAAPAPAPVPAPTPPAADEVLIVEYLNAYCPHCRATEARLDKVVAEMGLKVRKRRVYTWATMDYPAWARACALAQTMGLEERMFSELLASRGPDVSEVRAAAQRAGVPLDALDAALRDPTPPPRLVKDRQLFSAARLQGLPTLDIGRRRLMGEQSEQELRNALMAARPAAPPAPAR
jgi:uncharacterized membrane protein